MLKDRGRVRARPMQFVVHHLVKKRQRRRLRKNKLEREVSKGHEMNIDCSYDELVEVHKLIPNPKNPNSHTPEQIGRLSKLIDFQGQRSPIIVSKRSGFIIVGHGRFEAMKALGWEKVAVDYQDFVDDAQEYAHMCADNAIAEWSKLDLTMVNSDLLDLGPDFDIEVLGIKDFNAFDFGPIEIDTPKDDSSRKWVLEVTFPNEMEMRDIHDDLEHKGYIVKVKGE